MLGPSSTLRHCSKTGKSVRLNGASESALKTKSERNLFTINIVCMAESTNTSTLYFRFSHSKLQLLLYLIRDEESVCLSHV